MRNLKQSARRVNLGCGNRHHPGWINIDISSPDPSVIAHDLTKGIPLESASCDVVYHSHLLEHLRRPDVLPFMKECFRVLKAGGILRVATPDLEQIARSYLEKLDGALQQQAGAAEDYEWIMLEMYDQAVREKPGGGMRDYLARDPLPNEEFVYQRIGEECRLILEALRHSASANSAKPFKRRLSTTLLRRVWTRLRTGGTRVAVHAFLGREGVRAFDLGQFRLSGEVHHWMYDQYSLARLMRAAGFTDPKVQGAMNSLISDWADIGLDTLPDGRVQKPDSLFMEAVKPHHVQEGVQ